MTQVRFIVALFSAALPLLAADAPLPELRIEPKSGGSIMFVRNTGTQPLTAFLIELVDYPGSSFTYLQDEAGVTVAPGMVKEISINNMTIGAVPDYVKLRAAIYQDGATAGDEGRIAMLIGRRRAILETTRELIRRIESGASQVDLAQWSDSLPAVARANRNQAAGINQAAVKSLIADTVKSLDADRAAVLSHLRASEQALAPSKPPL
jgi:hypothetical protein